MHTYKQMYLHTYTHQLIHAYIQTGADRYTRTDQNVSKAGAHNSHCCVSPRATFNTCAPQTIPKRRHKKYQDASQTRTKNASANKKSTNTPAKTNKNERPRLVLRSCNFFFVCTLRKLDLQALSTWRQAACFGCP